MPGWGIWLSILFLHCTAGSPVSGSLPCDPEIELGFYMTYVSLPYLMEQGECNVLIIFFYLLQSFSCHSTHFMVCIVVYGQLHQGDVDDAATVLKFSLCCVIEMVTGVAGRVNWLYKSSFPVL